MAARNEYIDVKDAMQIVGKVLKGYGSMNYSRLLMMTGLPQEILGKTLLLLEKNQVVEHKGEDDPIYSLTSKGRGNFNFWPFA
jgi:predicted transcriptional regulator